MGGCVCRILGIGPGLVSISPLSSSSRCTIGAWFIGRFFRVLRFMFRCLLFLILLSGLVVCLGCLVVLFFVCLVCVVLYWFLLLILFIWFWARPAGLAYFVFVFCFIWSEVLRDALLLFFMILGVCVCLGFFEPLLFCFGLSLLFCFVFSFVRV